MPSNLLIFHPEAFAHLKSASQSGPAAEALSQTRVAPIPGGGGLAIVPHGHFLAGSASQVLASHPNAPGFFAPPSLAIHRHPDFGRLQSETAGRIAWVSPHADGASHRVQSVSESDFRPLADWLPQTKYDWKDRPYVNYDDTPVTPKAKEHAGPYAWGMQPFNEIGAEQPTAPKPVEAPAEQAPSTPMPQIAIPAPKAKKKRGPVAKKVAAIIQSSLSETEQQKRTLEEQYRAAPGGLDSPERLTLMPQIAALDARLGRKSDAANGYLHALWEPGTDPAQLSQAWLKAEDPNASDVPTAAEFDADIGQPTTNPSDARRFAARILTAQHAAPDVLAAKAPELQDHLLRHEEDMPPRAAWLAWNAVAPHDTKGIAEARDRVLGRILSGNAIRRGLPSFLSGSGATSAAALSQYPAIAAAAKAWHDGDPNTTVNRPYANYLLAFGAAKTGNADLAHSLMREAQTQAKPGDPVHEFLHGAFGHRITQAIGGAAHGQSLPDPLMNHLSGIAGTMDKYAANRLRQNSWVLEPEQRVKAYHSASIGTPEYQALANAHGSKEFVAQASNMLKRATGNDRISTLANIVPLLPRGSGEFAAAVLHDVPAALDKSAGSDAGTRISLLERSLFLAAHYGNQDLVKNLFSRAESIVGEAKGRDKQLAIGNVAANAVQGLAKTGLSDLGTSFLERMEKMLTNGKPLADVKAANPNLWASTAAGLSGVAEGWNAIGATQRADRLLNDIGADLAKPWPSTGTNDHDMVHAVSRYISAAGNGNPDAAVTRLANLFRSLPKLAENRMSTKTHFSEPHTTILDSLAKAMAGEGMQMSEQSKKWLDEDEYLTRRRIHSDTNHALKKAGL